MGQKIKLQTLVYFFIFAKYWRTFSRPY